ncbi:hypothetical protein EW146_g636 [Bondarzewia mesenterica]|uniref:Palmitoyl-protein thioesterase 1 n=1 Tax=Bondarzewia mesenterica TaxID=1095465 RepID=A0A4S4M6A8_9AGAM|nr:hypothetical protein EW146_g636 [Bondarzewia mesenterica]
MGVSDFPLCRPFDLLCQVARNAARAGVYRPWAQEHLVQAQYYRDPAQLPLYLSANHFLTSVNNEIPTARNATYKQNFASLENLVLILFAQDKTVVPKESAWFGSYAPPEDAGGRGTENEKKVVPMRAQLLYTEDWIGLRKLDEKGAVKLKTCNGEHMQLSRDCWEPIVKKYVGGVVEW